MYINRWVLKTFKTMVAMTMGLSLAHAGTVTVAVAANFAAPARQLAAEFEQDSGHSVKLALGSTGGLAAQIRQGAPFDVLLAADEATPQALEAEGLTVPGSRWTYAKGRLVLWSAQPEVVDAQGHVLKDAPAHVNKLAMANPKTAPYGAAALQVLQHLGVQARWQGRLVQGENVAQAHQMVATGHATLGLLAWSQVQHKGQVASGSAWLVPEAWHSPLVQQGVWLARASGSDAARAWLAFLKTPKAQNLIREHGYP